MSLDVVKRRVVPSAVVRLSQVTAPARAGAALRRVAGRPGEVELFFAFDDPCSAAAVLDLTERLRGRPVELRLRPVVRRGIPGDPAVELKRAHALADARRLARRMGRELARTALLRPEDTAVLAAWVARVDPGPPATAFVREAMGRLWFAYDDRVVPGAFEHVWRRHFGTAPRQDEAGLRANERRMRRLGPYDVPAAVAHGRWWFAHDRPAQIGEWLDELGWRAA